jgi:hypothetical protein
MADIPKDVRSEPVGDDDDEVIAQQPVGVDNMEGGGEFPDPNTEPRSSAPGTDPTLRREIEEKRRTG